MFRVKICGITNVEDAVAAVEAGADAIGLNFYEGSKRRVTQVQAREITASLPPDFLLGRVGVFVNHLPAEIWSIVQQAGIYAIQLHGDEPPETAAILTELKHSHAADLSKGFHQKGLTAQAEALERGPAVPMLIRARRMPDDGLAAILRDLDACREAGGIADSVLLDAATPGRYGGTGETVSWVGLADHRRWLGDIPLILAGGLTPDNVAEAIRIVRPAAVDVASGVESAPGKKDPAKVRDFVAAALAAFGA